MQNKKRWITTLTLMSCAVGSIVAQEREEGQGTQWPAERPPEQVITPNAGPYVSNMANAFVTAEFIYWKTREDGLGYAATGFANATVGTIMQKGQVLQPNFKFTPGYRVGAGLTFGHDGWDLYARYTWLRQNNAHSSFSMPISETTLTNLWPLSGDNISITDAAGLWKIHFNAIDWELGRNFYISKFLALRTHGGIKGGWQHQRLLLDFSGQNVNFTQTISDRMKQCFRGVGMRAGLNATWYATKNFSFYTDASLAGLLSRFRDMRRRDTTTTTGGATAEATQLFTQNKFYTLTPLFEFGLGFRGEDWFHDEAFHYEFDIGWEEQVWLSMNQFFQPSEQGDHGKLSLYGLTVKARFDF